MSANLEANQFQPGESGNPAGRPKGSKDGLRACLRRELDKAPSQDIMATLQKRGIGLDDPTCAGAIAAILVEQATEGDLNAIREIFRQSEPPLKTTSEIQLPGPSTIEFVINEKMGLKPTPTEDLE